MKIYSEKTNKEYATVDECLAAERQYDEAVAKAKAEKEKALAEKKAKEEKLNAERKARAEEVEKAYKAVIEANKTYQEVLRLFVKDYGSFHMTLRDDNIADPFSILRIFNTLF